MFGSWLVCMCVVKNTAVYCLTIQKVNLGEYYVESWPCRSDIDKNIGGYDKPE